MLKLLAGMAVVFVCLLNSPSFRYSLSANFLKIHQDEEFVRAWSRQFDNDTIAQTCPGADKKSHYPCFLTKALSLMAQKELALTATNKIISTGFNLIKRERIYLQNFQPSEKVILDNSFYIMHMMLWSLPIIESYEPECQEEAQIKDETLKRYLKHFLDEQKSATFAIDALPSSSLKESYQNQILTYSRQFESLHGRVVASVFQADGRNSSK